MHLWIFVILAFVVGMNLGCAALATMLLRRRRPHPRGLIVAAWVWVSAMIALGILNILQDIPIQPFLRDDLYPALSTAMVWNILVLQPLVPALILIVLILGRARPVQATDPELPPDAISRRRFLYLVGCGAAPAVAVSMGVHGTLTRYDLRLQRYDIPIANLPPGLQGFTIAHVSDLHSGVFVGPERLKLMTDLANDTRADLVLVTGDLINRAMEEFPPALAALQRIESRLGMYLCEGNHDVIPGDGLIVAACRQNGLRMLYGECLRLPINGTTLVLGGLPWMNPGPETAPTVVSSLFPARQQGDVRVLMAHHPHLFDYAADVDLVLSGHTHGGQIMFGDVGLGNLRFKYNSGRFTRASTTMIVNNGCGDWFPCRIGAPAEIGLLRLVTA
jgi:predicted MPP superfamily phosphohydrolase